MVKNKWQSESSKNASKSFISLLDKTHFKFFLMPLFKEELERTLPELVPEVPSEDKLLMSPHLEESTKQFILCARVQERLHSDLTNQWLRPSLMKSLTPQRELVVETLSLSKRRMKLRDKLRVTDELNLQFVC